ncbi:MAG: PEP-CTERM sorting domain-containing protein [Fimbriimonadaceae bacterium]|nr:PEP-CTERM sorting domain-containing protein [Fimbriimonadaceae bacterium]
MRPFVLRFGFALTSLTGLCSCMQAQPQYRIKEIAPPAGYSAFAPTALHSSGAMVGYVDPPNFLEGVYADAFGTPTAIPQYGSGFRDVSFFDLNGSGLALGYANSNTGGPAAMLLWDSVSGYRRILHPGTDNVSVKRINDAGQTAVMAELSPGVLTAFIWDAVNGFQTLADPGGEASVNDLAESGRSVGTATISGSSVGVVWNPDRTVAHLIHAAGGYLSVSGDALNSSGHVAGMTFLSGTGDVGYAWSESMGFVPTGSFQKDGLEWYMGARSVSESGVVLGVRVTASTSGLGGLEGGVAIWTHQSGIAPIESLLSPDSAQAQHYYLSASASDGSFVGWAIRSDQSQFYYHAAPVPEPASALALAVGLAAIARRRRAHRREKVG